MTNEELATAIKEGHAEYIPALWDQVVQFISILAGKWKRAHPDSLAEVEDLVQSGYFALLKAVQYYAPDGEYKFITSLSMMLKSAFAEAAGLRTQKQRRTAQLQMISLDTPLGGDEDNDLLVDMIADPNAEAPFERLALSEEQRMIRDVLNDAANRLLTAKQREVFTEMLTSDQHITDIASTKNMSKQTVSRLMSDSFWKLRADTQVQALYVHVFGLEDDLTSESLGGTGLTSFKNTGLSVVERVAFRRMRTGLL